MPQRHRERSGRRSNCMQGTDRAPVWKYLGSGPMMTRLGIVLALTVVWSALSEANVSVLDANTYVDRILVSLVRTIDGSSRIDPLCLPEDNSGNWRTKNSCVKGLSHLRRHDDCTIEVYNETGPFAPTDSGVHIQCSLETNTTLELNTQYRVYMLLAWNNGDMRATIDHVRFNILLSTGPAGGEVRMENLRVDKFLGFRIVDATGFRPFNWFFRAIVNTFGDEYKTGVTDGLRERMNSALEGPVGRERLVLMGVHDTERLTVKQV